MSLPIIHSGSEAITSSLNPATKLTAAGQKISSTQENQRTFESVFRSQSEAPQKDELKEAFQNFVGQTFFSQMISSMRSTQKEAAYFHGGQAEKVFQGQLDQILTDELTKASASQIADPMFDLFQLRRS